MDNKEIIIARLELIAAKAKILVNDYRFGKLWGGDLSRGLEELKKEIDKKLTNRTLAFPCHFPISSIAGTI